MGVSPFQGWPLGWLLRRGGQQIDASGGDSVPGSDSPAPGKEEATDDGLRPYAHPRDEPMPSRRSKGLRRRGR